MTFVNNHPAPLSGWDGLHLDDRLEAAEDQAFAVEGEFLHVFGQARISNDLFVHRVAVGA